MPAILETPRARQIREKRALAEAGEKRCAQCGEAKPYAGFNRNRAQADGYSGRCRKCDNERCRSLSSCTERHRRWRAENPEVARAAARKKQSARRARVRGAFVEDIDPRIVFERDEGVCGICGEPVDHDRYDIDHIVPLADEGEHSYENVRVAHPSCNRAKGRAVSLALAG